MYVPETEDFLSLKRGPQIVLSCHIWFLNMKNSNSCTNAENKNLHHTKAILKKLQSLLEKRDTESSLNLPWMHAVPPLLHTFPVAGIHFFTPFSWSFRLQPMHVFSFHINKMMNECLIEMHGDFKRTSAAIEDSERKEMSLKRTRKHCTKLLHHVSKSFRALFIGLWLVRSFQNAGRLFSERHFFKKLIYCSDWNFWQRFFGPDITLSWRFHRRLVRKEKLTRNFIASLRAYRAVSMAAEGQ